MSQAPSRPPFLTRWREQWAKARRDRAVWQRITTLDLHLAREVTASLPAQPVKLACMVIARGEDDYLVEWLEFHRMMGIEHFFFYDNGMQASTAELLRPYVEEKVVTHLPFPDLDWPELRKQWDRYDEPGQQEVAYAHCVLRFSSHALYLAKLDVDEFLYPAQLRHATVVDVLSELDRASVCGIEVPRVEFGHNEQMRREPGLVLERFTRCAPGNATYKSIGNTAFLEHSLGAGNAHSFAYRTPVPLRLIRGFRPILLCDREAAQLLRVNHYFSKSLDEYLRKGEVNAQGFMAGKDSKPMFYVRNRHANQVEDTGIQRYLPALRERLERRETGAGRNGKTTGNGPVGGA